MLRLRGKEVEGEGMLLRVSTASLGTSAFMSGVGGTALNGGFRGRTVVRRIHLRSPL